MQSKPTLPAFLLICAAALTPAAATAQQQTPAPPPAQAPAADKPIATVNGVPTPQSLLDQAVKQAVAAGNPDSPHEAGRDRFSPKTIYDNKIIVL